MEKEMNYLMITIHDNDFWYSIEKVSEIIRDELMWYKWNDITDESIPMLKESVRDILIAIQKIKHSVGMYKDENKEIDYEYLKEYFTPSMEIVNKKDIVEDGNGEIAYIPISHDEGLKILYR